MESESEDTAPVSGDPRIAIGIDLGGTNTEIGKVDASGNVVARKCLRTKDYPTVEGFVKAVGQACRELGMENVEGIGIGAPASNSYTGCIEGATALPWPPPTPLCALLELELGVPVRITNDANAAAYGAMVYGVARGYRDFLMITLGTGVGSGIVCDRRLINGSHGFAGEMGHAIVEPDGGRKCPCGRVGCLEMYGSAKGIVMTAEEILDKSPQPSKLRQMRIKGELSPYTIAKAAEDGDALAIETLRFTGKVLGRACANFVTFSDPEAIVLFGGIVGAGNLLTDPMREEMEKNLLYLYKGKIKIVVDPGHADSAILGAASLVGGKSTAF